MQNAHDYIRKTLNYDFAQTLIDIMAECNCCAEHSINKPTVFQPWTSNYACPLQIVKECKCDCRHTARMICRLCPTEPDIRTPTKPIIRNREPPRLCRQPKFASHTKQNRLFVTEHN